MNTKARAFAVLSAAALGSLPPLAGAGALDQLRGAAPAGRAGAVAELAAVPIGAPVAAPQGIGGGYIGETRRHSFTRRAGEDSFAVALEVPIYKVWTELAPVREVYEELVCEEIPGDGKGDWKGYFNAPKAEKAKRLAQAIAGVGPGTAQCVVDSGAFGSKPRTWSDFKARMRQADDACKNGLYYKAVVEHGQTNAKNLGYASAERCHVERVEEVVLKPVERRVYSHTARQDVSVEVRGAPLLPSESESIEVVFDGFKAVVSPSSRFNQYQTASKGPSDFVLTGTRLRATPNNSLTVEVLPGNGGDVLVRVTDTDYQAGADNPQAQTVAIIAVMKPRTLWFDKQIAAIRLTLSAGKGETTLRQHVGSGLAKGNVYYLTYKLARSNSRFNNSSESAAQSSPKLTY